MKRDLSVGLLVVVFLLAVGALTIGAAPSRAGQIAYMVGDVAVNGRDAQIGHAVPIGATVQTGPGSVCEITWGTQNIIQIQEDTLAVMETGSLMPGIRLQRGSVAAVLNRVDSISARGTFRIRTPSAVAGVRGTAFFVKVEDAANTYVCACNGTIGVTRGLRRQADLTSSAHMARRFTRAGPATRITQPGLLYHDSSSMDNLAQKIGYTIPWEQGPYGQAGSGGYGY